MFRLLEEMSEHEEEEFEVQTGVESPCASEPVRGGGLAGDGLHGTGAMCTFLREVVMSDRTGKDREWGQTCEGNPGRGRELFICTQGVLVRSADVLPLDMI